MANRGAKGDGFAAQICGRAVAGLAFEKVRSSSRVMPSRVAVVGCLRGLGPTTVELLDVVVVVAPFDVAIVCRAGRGCNVRVV